MRWSTRGVVLNGIEAVRANLDEHTTGEGGYEPEGNYGFELPGPDHGDFGPILSASFPAA